MKTSEYSELRFIADAIVCVPERFQEVFDCVTADQKTPETVRCAVKHIYDVFCALNDDDYDVRLVCTVERLTDSQDETARYAGSAVYYALRNSRRPQIRNVLDPTYINLISARLKGA